MGVGQLLIKIQLWCWGLFSHRCNLQHSGFCICQTSSKKMVVVIGNKETDVSQQALLCICTTFCSYQTIYVGCSQGQDAVAGEAVVWTESDKESFTCITRFSSLLLFRIWIMNKQCIFQCSDWIIVCGVQPTSGRNGHWHSLPLFMILWMQNIYFIQICGAHWRSCCSLQFYYLESQCCSMQKSPHDIN